MLLRMLAKTKKEKVIKETRTHESDTGSPEVQVALLSKRIDELAKHLKKNNNLKNIYMMFISDRFLRLGRHSKRALRNA